MTQLNLLILCWKVTACNIIQMFSLLMILRRMITKKRKKLYCVICDKYKTFEKPEISYFLEKTLVISIIYRKWINEEEKLF